MAPAGRSEIVLPADVPSAPIACIWGPAYRHHPRRLDHAVGVLLVKGTASAGCDLVCYDDQLATAYAVDLRRGGHSGTQACLPYSLAFWRDALPAAETTFGSTRALFDALTRQRQAALVGVPGLDEGVVSLVRVRRPRAMGMADPEFGDLVRGKALDGDELRAVAPAVHQALERLGILDSHTVRLAGRSGKIDRTWTPE
jgi:hypothetical protein